MKAFKNPAESLGELNARTAAAVVTAVADIVLVVDDSAVIRDIAVSSEDLAAALDSCRGWVGKPWRDLVTMESRPKLEALLADAGKSAAPRWRHLNHMSAHGIDAPVAYAALRLAAPPRILAMGRDLRGISNLQQRLVDAQQAMDQDYVRLQQLDLRYRLLFQSSPEVIFILDIATGLVIEANSAALSLLEESTRRMTGRPFAELFTEDSAEGVQLLLATLRASGRAEDVPARFARGAAVCTLSAVAFRQDTQSLGFVRLTRASSPPAPPVTPDHHAKLVMLIEHAPDAVVMTRSDSTVLYANAAFLDLAQLSHREQAEGAPLDRWLGQQGLDVGVLAANLKQRGSLRLFATTFRGEHGFRTDVEVSGVAVTHHSQPAFGYIIRNVGRRLAAGQSGGPKALQRSPEQITELIGRVPLRDLVRETTDVIERLCIEAALELTGNNRASAAELLGLSRQSLYVKLRRFGIAEDAEEDDV